MKKTEEQRRFKIRIALLGKSKSEETKMKMSIAHSGKSRTKKVNWMIVRTIRQLYITRPRKYIYQLFYTLNHSTINDIIANRTWKDPSWKYKPLGR